MLMRHNCLTFITLDMMMMMMMMIIIIIIIIITTIIIFLFHRLTIVVGILSRVNLLNLQ